MNNSKTSPIVNMKPVAISLMVGLLTVSNVAYANQTVNQTLDADSDSHVDIEHMNGSAVIKGWDRDEVMVKGELSEKAKEFIFERSGKRVEIKVEMEHSSYNGKSWGNWNSGSGDDLTIFVPKNSRVTYNSINASVNSENIHGGLDIEVVNGSIDVDDASGRVRLESVNGSIDANKVSGDVQIETVNGSIEGDHSGKGEIGFESVNGDISISTDSPEISAETVNGDLDLRLQEVDELDLSSVNGSIDVVMDLQSNGDVRISTVGGSVDLTFQKGVSARFDIQGHAGGRFVNRLTDDKMQKAKYGPRRWLEFETGSGSAKVEVSTVNGRVELDSQ